MENTMIENLVDIRSLDKSVISAIGQRALALKRGETPLSLAGKHVAMMFIENSTRTRFSFEMALNKLGASVYNFDASKSSLIKGEDFFDTLNNLSAIGFDACIIRSSEEGLIQNTLDKSLTGRNFYKKIALINAGEGALAHPTQALLDYTTIIENFDNLEGLNLTIVGDIRHSRVVKSNVALLSKFGVNITCAAPEYFMDENLENVNWCENLDEALKNANIVMGLRIQRERIKGTVEFAEYIENYQINEQNLPENCLLMHPGPINRDIEISSELLNSEKGKTIMDQAHNGVYTRMAVLEMILGTQHV